MPATPTVRVVVRLPWNRPEQPLADPPRIEWNDEKADTLWKVMARSRASDSGGTDWKALAAHLEVPLPYLLFRAQTRFEEDLRGLQDITGALSPSAIPSTEEFPLTDKPTLAGRAASRMTGSTRLSSSARLATPLGVRARLSSLGHNSPYPKKATSSSTLTLQGPKKAQKSMKPASHSSSEDSDSDEDRALMQEEADKALEEQETLDRKLKDLRQMMTSDALGLVRSSRPKDRKREVDRGRARPGSSRPLEASMRNDTLSSRSTSTRASSSSSPQGSIPSIPSPPPDHPRSPMSRHLSPIKSSSLPTVSSGSARGQSHLRYGPTVGQNASEQESNQGSEASSFSDISEASLSASALESALVSVTRGTGSRFSAFARSHLIGRGGGAHY